MTPPLSFVEKCLTLEGALVEAQGSSLEAVLPAALARALELPELSVLTDEEQAGALRVGYGTQLLERFLHLAMAKVPVAAARAVLAPGRASMALEAAQGFSLRNGVRDLGTVRPHGGRRLWLQAAWKARTDEEREGVASAVVSLDTGTPVAGFEEAVRLEPMRGASVPRGLGQRALTAGLARCVESGTAQTAAFRDASARRFERDRARLAAYFDDLLAELGRRAGRGRGEEAAAQDKRCAIERERTSKLDALVARSAFRLEVRPLAAAVVETGAFAVQVKLRRRKGSREVELEYDCATRSLVPHACEACGQPAPRPAACDDALHLLCVACAPNAQGRIDCPACRG